MVSVPLPSSFSASAPCCRRIRFATSRIQRSYACVCTYVSFALFTSKHAETRLHHYSQKTGLLLLSKSNQSAPTRCGGPWSGFGVRLQGRDRPLYAFVPSTLSSTANPPTSIVARPSFTHTTANPPFPSPPSSPLLALRAFMCMYTWPHGPRGQVSLSVPCACPTHQLLPSHDSPRMDPTMLVHEASSIVWYESPRAH